MKRKLFLLTLGIAFTMLVAQLNRVDVFAVTQDELIQMWEEENAKYGIDSEHCKSTGGTANDSLTDEEIKKIEEVNSNKTQSQPVAPQPTKAPEPTKAVEEPKKEVVETVEETTAEPTTEEITTTEETTEEITSEEPTTIEETTTEQETTEEETTTEEIEEPQTTANWLLIGIVALVLVVAFTTVALFIRKKRK